VRAGAFDRRANLGLAMHRQVVEDDHIPPAQRWDQDLLDIRAEALVIDRPIEDRGGGQALGPQGGNDGVRLPMPAGRVIAEPCAPGTPPIATEQVGGDAAFIDKDVLSRVTQREPIPPPAPLSGDVRSSLFVGVYRFF
jgi:hypothetical protein